LLTAAPGARLVVIGDSDFVRDDLVTGEYQRIGGPMSVFGPTFFVNLLDWLAGDQDLYDLRGKGVVDRTQRFLTPEEVRNTTNLQRTEQIRRGRESFARLWNTAVPPSLMLLFGVVVFASRRARKRAFLDRTT
jgi:ABC-type uncharacterized transport system involved in gliding motility auxiliary subunit